MNKCNLEDTYLFKYREAIRNGEIQAGIEMVQMLDNLIEDFHSDEYMFDPVEANLRIDFIQSCVKLTKSPFYGKPFILMLWQKAFIEVMYSFKMKSLDSGEWVDRFQETLLLICRKNGKTELIAAIQFSELILGKNGSDIICSGTDENIADLCYLAIDRMRILVDPDSIDTWRNQKGITCLFNNNSLKKLTEASRGKEGRNIDVAGLDEVWSLLKDGIYEPIRQSVGTKDSFKIFMFGSEGFVEGEFLDEKLEEYRKIIFKEDESESSKRKLPWIYTQDSENEVWETNENGINPLWEKSNPSIGTVKKWSYLRDRVDEAKKSKSARMFVLAKDFDFKVNSGQSWLMRDMYQYEATYEIEKLRNSFGLGSVDLSQTTDMTSAKMLVRKPNDPTKYILSMYWIPESKLTNSDDRLAGARYKEWAKDGLIRICQGNEVTLTEVADWFFELFQSYNIYPYRIGYDDRLSKPFINKCKEYGFDVDVIQQGKALSSAMNQTEADFVSRIFNYNGNEIDKWCFENIAVKIDDYGMIQPVKQKMLTKRIDGALTMIMCNEMYRRYSDEYLQIVR